MADPRIIDIALDDKTIVWRNADVEQERRIAIYDLIEDNSFAPCRADQKGYGADGYAGPYKVFLSVREGRLVVEIRRTDDSLLEAIIPASPASGGRSRSISRSAIPITRRSARPRLRSSRRSTWPRRAVHIEAAQLLMAKLDGKIAVDFDTARRLFTLICVLHFRG